MYNNNDNTAAYIIGRQVESNRRNIRILDGQLARVDKKLAKLSLLFTISMVSGYILRSQVHGINERLKKLEKASDTPSEEILQED